MPCYHETSSTINRRIKPRKGKQRVVLQSRDLSQVTWLVQFTTNVQDSNSKYSVDKETRQEASTVSRRRQAHGCHAVVHTEQQCEKQLPQGDPSQPTALPTDTAGAGAPTYTAATLAHSLGRVLVYFLI